MTNPKPMKATKRERELVVALKRFGQHYEACAVPRLGAANAKHCTCGLAAAIRGGGR